MQALEASIVTVSPNVPAGRIQQNCCQAETHCVWALQPSPHLSTACLQHLESCFNIAVFLPQDEVLVGDPLQIKTTEILSRKTMRRKRRHPRTRTLFSSSNSVEYFDSSCRITLATTVRSTTGRPCFMNSTSSFSSDNRTCSRTDAALLSSLSLYKVKETIHGDTLAQNRSKDGQQSTTLPTTAVFASLHQ